jgi:hypothetical protein
LSFLEGLGPAWFAGSPLVDLVQFSLARAKYQRFFQRFSDQFSKSFRGEYSSAWIFAWGGPEDDTPGIL